MSTDDLAPRMGFAVTRLARQLRQQDEGDLTPTLRATLATIERDGPLTLGELANAERIAPPTVTKVVGKLADAGLVDRIPDAADRRVCRVAISEAGQERLDIDRSRRMAWLASRLAELDEADRKRLADATDILERLVAHEARA